MFTGLDRYLFGRLLKAQIAMALVLAGIVWLVQTLNMLEDMIGQNVSPVAMAELAGLIIPRVLSFTLAPALLVTMLVQLMRLLQDNEYFALTAAGLSPLRILRPVIGVCVLVIALQAALSFYISPIAYKAMRAKSENLATDFVLAALRPGIFNDIEDKMVIFAAGKASDGSWRDVMIHDYTLADAPTTYIAEAGRLRQEDGQVYFLLTNGEIFYDAAAQRSNGLQFDQYSLPIQQTEARAAKTGPPNRNSMLIHQLFEPEKYGVTHPKAIERARAHGFERIGNLTAPLVYTLICFACITAGGLNRHGYSRRVTLAVFLCVFFQIALIGTIGRATASGNVHVIALVPSLTLVFAAIFLYFEVHKGRWPFFGKSQTASAVGEAS